MTTENQIRQEERKKIGRQLHDVIANELLHLQFLILKTEGEINKERFTEIIDELEFIRNQVRGISHRVIAPTVTNVKQSFSVLVKELLLEYAFLFPDITFNYNVFPKKFTFSFDGVKQQELSIVLKELIQNSLQHGKPSVIEVNITDFDSYVNLILEDNGKGFNTQKPVEGIGIKNCKERILQQNGRLIIDSSIEKGTTVNIDLYK